MEKSRKLEISKSKSSRFVMDDKTDARLNFEIQPSSPSSYKNSHSVGSVNSRIDRNEEEEDGVFEIYYERNRDMLEDEYPDASEQDIKKYLRKTWDSMDSTFRKKYRLYMTRDSNSVYPKESSSDHEDDISIETDISTKENKRVKSKIDRDESSILETKRVRPYNLFKGMKQEKVCQICEKTGKLTRCKGPCYSYFHLSCVKPGESSPEHSIDENMSDDKILDDLNVIKKSINGEDDNNGNYSNT